MLLNYLKDNCRVYTVQVGQFIYSIRLETWVKLGIACLYIASLVIAVVTIWVEEGDNIEKLLQNFLRFVDGLSWYGILLYGVVYIGTVVILFPAVILTLGAGFVFGLWKVQHATLKVKMRRQFYRREAMTRGHCASLWRGPWALHLRFFLGGHCCAHGLKGRSLNIRNFKRSTKPFGRKVGSLCSSFG
jgi:hypothetical protein